MKTTSDFGINGSSLINLGAVKRIAVAYDQIPDEMYLIEELDRILFQSLVQKQFEHIVNVGGVKFEFVSYEPYRYELVNELMPDYHDNRRILVNSTGNNSDFWGMDINLMFRAVHDYFHVINNLDFNYRDEVEAYEQQFRHSYFMFLKYGIAGINFELYAKLLRSEIVYQAAVKSYFNKFHLEEQKIILQSL